MMGSRGDVGLARTAVHGESCSAMEIVAQQVSQPQCWHQSQGPFQLEPAPVGFFPRIPVLPNAKVWNNGKNENM